MKKPNKTSSNSRDSKQLAFQNDIEINNIQESYKFLFEIAKHLSTLSTGAIVVFVSILGIIKAVDINNLIFIVTVFILSMFIALLVMLALTYEIQKREHIKSTYKIYVIMEVVIIILFLFGIVLIGSYGYLALNL